MRSRVLYFTLGIVLTGVVALLTVPAMIHASGLQVWADVAVGQGLGSICFAFIAWGWGVTGPSVVASAPDEVRRQEFFSSVLARSVVALVALPVFFAIAAVSAQDSALLACLGVLSTAALGVCGNWYFTGTGEAKVMFFIEVMPRVIGTLLGTGVMLVFDLPAAVSLIGTIAGILLALGLELLWVRTRVAPGVAYRRDPLIPMIFGQRSAATISLVSSGYASLPIVLVTHVNPTAVAVFAVLDKLNKQSVTAVGPVFNIFQGWIPKTGRDIKSRATRAIAVTSAIALGHLLGYVVLGQLVIRVLSNGEVSATLAQTTLTGLAGSLYLLDAVVGRAAMVPLLKLRELQTSTLVCVVLGLASVAGLTPAFGAAGAMAGYAVGLGARVVWGGIVVLRAEEPRPARLQAADAPV